MNFNNLEQKLSEVLQAKRAKNEALHAQARNLQRESEKVKFMKQKIKEAYLNKERAA